MSDLAEGGNDDTDQAELVTLPRETVDAVRSFVSSVTTAGETLLGVLQRSLDEGT